MMKLIALSAILVSGLFAVDAPITGTVSSKCTIVTTTEGIYGNPLPNKLSTNPADGGVLPIIRYDVVQADAYKAIISYPTSFTTSPVLNDTVAFSGEIEVSEVSDTEMATYETNKVTYNNSTEFDLKIAGSVWFKASALAQYGQGKSLPGGTYISAVVAECIAK